MKEKTKNSKKRLVAKKEVVSTPVWDTVDALLSSVVKTPLTRVEIGATHVAIAEVYADVTQALLSGYRDALKGTIKTWKKLDTMEERFNEKLALAKVRSSLTK
ncbi:MAG: hypothetical protein NUV54_02455 [Candidatus Taylorbacteria bacterium]|nr:hypothetical protein [Candidatus Taylorbacteria bacterium]